MIQIGVVGAGPWGNNLVRNVAECDQTNLAVVCDLNRDVLERINRRYPNTRTVTRYEDLLATDGLDAVIIATPAHLHFDCASQALAAGFHCLVEKPLSTNSHHAAELCRLAAESNRVLMCGHTFLYNNLLHDVKRRIDAGELGRLRYLYSRRLNLGRVRQDVDALWNLAPHDISSACYLLDAWPTSVNARGWSYLQPHRNIADVCFFQMDFDGGRAFSGHVSWLDPQKDRTIVVVGSEKMLVYDDMNHARHIQIYDKGVEMSFQSPLDRFSDHAARIRSGDLTIPNVRPVEPLALEIAHFAECVQTGQTPRSDGRQGLRLVCVLEAMSRSMKGNGRLVRVDYSPDHRIDSEPAARHDEATMEQSTWPQSRSMISAPST